MIGEGGKGKEEELCLHLSEPEKEESQAKTHNSYESKMDLLDNENICEGPLDPLPVLPGHQHAHMCDVIGEGVDPVYSPYTCHHLPPTQ